MKRVKSVLVKAKERAQKVFNEWIRLRDSYDTTGSPWSCVCCTCGTEHPNDGHISAGHFILDSKNGNSTSFDEHNVHGQCTHYCNRNMHGNLGRYALFIIKKYGANELEELYRKKLITKKWTIDELENIYLDYKNRIKTFYD